jgi:AraC-like DNA-binding protein
MVLNFGAPHTRVEAGSGSDPQQLDRAWVAGLQTRYHLSEAIGERRFMVVRFTPLGAHLFLRVAMDSLADRAVPLGQIDAGLAATVTDPVLAASGWAARFDAVERLVGSRIDEAAPPAHLEWAWEKLSSTAGQVRAGWLAAEIGCSPRHLIQQFRTGIGLSPKKAAMVLRFNRSIDAVTRAPGPGNSRPGSPRRPYLQGSSPLSGGELAAPWADVAADCGYFDQPHFIRDFRAFAGVTPTEFARGIPGPRR